MKSVLIQLVRGYQVFLRAWLGNQCRFTPRCSDYAIEALETHGALQGSYLASKRLLRCHPWCVGGIDPVPSKPPNKASEPSALASKPQAHRDALP